MLMNSLGQQFGKSCYVGPELEDIRLGAGLILKRVHSSVWSAVVTVTGSTSAFPCRPRHVG